MRPQPKPSVQHAFAKPAAPTQATPQPAAPAKAGLGQSAPMPVLGDRRVLIIDPFEASRGILKDTATQLGARHILLSSTYSDAMRSLRRPDNGIGLIFCEHNLNGSRDGQQLLEELRSEHVISLATVFFMVTGEAGYKRVVSVAEFAPDDYVVKPYSVDQLHRRLGRTLYKKKILTPIYALIESDQALAAIDECHHVALAHPVFAVDCWRLAIDLLTGLGELERAQQLLNQVLAKQALPWAMLGLASIRMQEARLDEAIRMLEDILRENPEFLRVRDALADAHFKRGEKHQALRVLEEAVSMSDANVTRMRRVGEIYEAVGDLAGAERAYAQVLNRTRDSAMLSSEDYANLSRTLVEQGKLDEAMRIADDQKKMLRGHSDLELASALLEFQRTARSDASQIPAAAQRLIAIEAKDEKGGISPRLIVQVIRACLHHGQEDAGLRVAGKLATRGSLDPAIQQEVREMLDEYRAAQLRNRYLTVDEVDAGIRQIIDTGFDEDLARDIERSLPALSSVLDAEHWQLLHRNWSSAKAKYGLAR
jgi:tetratricopeptide (TPR) repeat protein